MKNVKEMLATQSGVAHIIVSWYNLPVMFTYGTLPTFGRLELLIQTVNSCAAAGLESAPPRGVRAEVRETAAGGIEFRLVQMKMSNWVVLPDSADWITTINANIAQFNSL